MTEIRVLSVTAMQIVPEKIVDLEKGYSRAYGKMKYSPNKEVKSHVRLFRTRHDQCLF